jgi:hypothetical protein
LCPSGFISFNLLTQHIHQGHSDLVVDGSSASVNVAPVSSPVSMMSELNSYSP